VFELEFPQHNLQSPLSWWLLVFCSWNVLNPGLPERFFILRILLVRFPLIGCKHISPLQDLGDNSSTPCGYCLPIHVVQI